MRWIDLASIDGLGGHFVNVQWRNVLDIRRASLAEASLIDWGNNRKLFPNPLPLHQNDKSWSLSSKKPKRIFPLEVAKRVKKCTGDDGVCTYIQYINTFHPILNIYPHICRKGSSSSSGNGKSDILEIQSMKLLSWFSNGPRLASRSLELFSPPSKYFRDNHSDELGMFWWHCVHN